jgi:deazaflavin-dependent oxidoreductase (nitroreductase family)
MAHYQRPDWVTRFLANPTVVLLTRVGVSLRGSRILAVRGRKSGEWRQTPVNPLNLEGQRYLVAPRGNTQWARNLRASGRGVLRLGRGVERFRAVEVDDTEKPPILRAYLQLWRSEAGKFFDVSGPDAPDDELRRIAPDHPVFRITTIEQ